jgi:hypothetical protein
MAGQGPCFIDWKPEPTFENAAAWIMAFYPDIIVRFEAGRASLSSAEREEAELRQIWAASLVNERLLVQGAARRAALLDELTR